MITKSNATSPWNNNKIPQLYSRLSNAQKNCLLKSTMLKFWVFEKIKRNFDSFSAQRATQRASPQHGQTHISATNFAHDDAPCVVTSLVSMHNTSRQNTRLATRAGTANFTSWTIFLILARPSRPTMKADNSRGWRGRWRGWRHALYLRRVVWHMLITDCFKLVL